MGQNSMFRQIAAQLPPYPVLDKDKNTKTITVTQVIKGNELIAKSLLAGILLEDIKDKEGNKINPKTTYHITSSQTVMVNHFEELKKCKVPGSKEETLAKVKAYIAKVMDYAKYTQKEPIKEPIIPE